MSIYGIVGESTQYVDHCPNGAVLMIEDRPTYDAIAQADGTWLVPEPVDISMAEADNLKTLFPVSYPGILAHIGMGDIV